LAIESGWLSATKGLGWEPVYPDWPANHRTCHCSVFNTASQLQQAHGRTNAVMTSIRSRFAPLCSRERSTLMPLFHALWYSSMRYRNSQYLTTLRTCSTLSMPSLVNNTQRKRSVPWLASSSITTTLDVIKRQGFTGGYLLAVTTTA
jgi:hypothetical protein